MAFRARSYDRPHFLLCEGEGDKRLFDLMLTRMSLENTYHVEFPDREGDPSGGRSKFGTKLTTLFTTSPTFLANVKGVLIVSDNDDDPVHSWQEVIAELQKAAFPIPPSPQIIARKPGYPAIAVLMLPIGAPGNLETLCLEAAYGKWPIKPAIEDFTNATPAAEWGAGKQSKMQLQALIAATCMTRPESGFVGHWREHDTYHIPLSDLCFRPLEDFLRDFPSLVVGP